MVVPDIYTDLAGTYIINFDVITTASDTIKSNGALQYARPNRRGGQITKFKAVEPGNFDRNLQFSYMFKDPDGAGDSAWTKYQNFVLAILTFNASNSFLKRLRFYDPDGGTTTLYGSITTVSFDLTVAGQVSGSFDFLYDSKTIFK